MPTEKGKLLLAALKPVTSLTTQEKQRPKRIVRWNRVISQTGGSLKVTVPKGIADELKLFEGAPVLLWAEDDTMHLMRMDKACLRFQDLMLDPIMPNRGGKRAKIKLMARYQPGEVKHNE